MAALSVTVERSMDHVTPVAWEALASTCTPFHQSPWMRNAPAPGALRLLVARRGDREVGLLPLYLVDAPTHYYHDPHEILCGVRERALFTAVGRSPDVLEHISRDRWFPCAIAMCPYGYRGGVIGDSSEAAACDIAAALVRAADACCREAEVHALLYYGLTAAADAPLIEALAGQGASTFIVGAHCDLLVEWPSLDAYFAALGPRGRKLRAGCRQAERDAGACWRTVPLGERGCDAALRDAAVELFSQTARRHGDAAPPADLYGKLLGTWPDPRYLLVGESADGRLRSALLVLQHGSTLYPKYFGAVAKGDYFHLTFAKTIELAIRLGATRIAYGGGSHVAKLLRGADLVWLTGAIVTYDTLGDALKPVMPAYSDAKREYFSELSARYAVRRRVAASSSAAPSLPDATPTGILT